MKLFYLIFSVFIISSSVMSLKDDQKIQQQPYCSELISEIDIKDRSFIGFSGQDLLDIASVEKTLLWQWDYKIGNTLLNMKALGNPKKARYIESVAVYPIDYKENIEIKCYNRLEVDANLYFSTQDGEFAEEWPVVLYETNKPEGYDTYPPRHAPIGKEVHFSKAFDANNLQGSFYDDIKFSNAYILSFLAQGVFSADYAQALVNSFVMECDLLSCYHYWLNAGHSY